MSLIARHLEENGIATVIMGCARDIVEHAGVPRYLWSDFPLGHSAGKPNDDGSKTDTLRRALALFDTATGPRTTIENPQRWSDVDDWKADFMDVSAIPPAKLDALKSEFAAQKAVASRIKAGA